MLRPANDPNINYKALVREAYDRCAQAYNEFLQAQPLAIEKYPRYNPHSKPTDLSNEVGLVAAYNMSNDSFALSKKLEVERQADSAR